jgi:glycosyltransferase involved in cell wall biosynthesis
MIVNQTPTPDPFFSIGITTFNRKDLLRKSLKSFLEQDFKDFEIIIGNDYISEPLSKEIVGYDDPRIIIVNNNQNLGELGNMNSLLNLARGRYFSWQFDDDLSAPGFLSEIYSAIIKFEFPLSAFTSFKYVYGSSDTEFKCTNKENHKLYSGREFLRSYLSGTIKALGSGGFHNTDYLKRLGGAERLSKGHMALYSEYILIIRDGLLNNVLYLSNNLIASRVHASSWSCNSNQVELYKEAGINLIRESLLVFSSPILKDDFQKNLNSLLKSVVSVVIVKKRMSGVHIGRKELSDYLVQIEDELKLLESPDLLACSLKSLQIVKGNLLLFHLKAELKVIIPEKRLKFFHIALSYISRFTNKSF